MARRPRSNNSSLYTSRSHFQQLLHETIPPIHPAGFPFIAAGIALGLLGRHHRGFACLGGGIVAGCAGFFRHPRRVPPTQEGIIVAPTDGQVCLIDTALPPPELAMTCPPLPRVSIFMSLFDAHVQRFPITGQIVDIRYRPGLFLSAQLPDASQNNERNSIRIRTANGQEIVVVQIAGLLARRILCQAHIGDHLDIGHTYGLIRFGSRVDIYLPKGISPLVRMGQRMVAGETPLAELL